MTGVILLAAGSSSRLGRPKQLVPWQGIPLIRHTAAMALDARLGPVTVVLGACVRPCREALDGLEVTIAINPDWESGMGGSISCGMSSLASHALENVIVSLCDLPLITPEIFKRLLALRCSDAKEIVASHNGTAFAPPILFSKNRFPRLTSLSGPEGARFLLRDESSIASIDCPEARADIDTPGDLADSGKWLAGKPPWK